MRLNQIDDICAMNGVDKNIYKSMTRELAVVSGTVNILYLKLLSTVSDTFYHRYFPTFFFNFVVHLSPSSLVSVNCCSHPLRLPLPPP